LFEGRSRAREQPSCHHVNLKNLNNIDFSDYFDRKFILRPVPFGTRKICLASGFGYNRRSSIRRIVMKRMDGVLLLLCGWLASGCTTTRKISQVGLREPSSVRETAALSALRAQITSTTELKKSCPTEIRENYAELAAARIAFPPCPAGLGETVQNSLPYLTLEERSTVEEVVNSQCRSLGSSEFGEALENMIAGYDTTGPIGRRAKVVQTLISVDGEARTLVALKEGVQELVYHHLPLDRWVRRNGEYVLPEEELKSLHRLIEVKGCRMSEEEVDQGYRTLRSLEELAKILKAGPQQEKIEAFIAGVHRVIEQKLKEFFYP
jgi:hypothetical protein